MSFHGGMLGVLAACMLFARAKHKHPADVLDFVAPLPGIGLMAGRIGNFINGELWGKPTDLPWGFGVPNAEGQLIARHPSQLYEATLEGLVLFVVLWWFTSKPRPRLAPTGSVSHPLRMRALQRWNGCVCPMPISDISWATG